ncbi:hypothetical protein Q7P37_010122 [Cladosporium fusiforme]
MPAPTLSAMAQNAAIRNISSITDIADLPYHAVEPILRRIDNPQQLREVEINCPHIAESSGPLWNAFIKRDVSNADRKMIYPKDPRSWWKVYRKMVKQEESEKADAEEALKRAMMGLQEAKGSSETKIVNKVMAQGQKKKTGFFDGVMHSGSGGGSKAMLWNAKNGRDALGAMQRATSSKQSVFKPVTRHTIPDAKAQIRVAPKSMQYSNAGNEAVLRAAAEAKRVAGQQSQRQRIFTPKSSLGKTELAFRTEEMKEQLERERRLRSLTNPTSRAAMHPVPAPTTSSTTSQRPSASTARSTGSQAGRPTQASLSPSPPRTRSPATQPAQQKPAAVKRKRPAVDPFLSTKRSRP